MRTSRDVWPKNAKRSGEGLVLVRVQARLGEELLEMFLTVGRQPVDDLGATSREGGGGLADVPRFLDQPAVGDQRLEAGVERPVAERPEHTVTC